MAADIWKYEVSLPNISKAITQTPLQRGSSRREYFVGKPAVPMVLHISKLDRFFVNISWVILTKVLTNATDKSRFRLEGKLSVAYEC